MLQGIVSILDPEHCEKVEALWFDLKREFGLKDAANAHPHVTYQVAEQYEITRAKGVLKRLARRAAPFRVRTSGLGIFTGDSPIVYIAVARSIHLANFHTRLWERISRTAHGVHAHHYGPDNFMPHITLAAGDLKAEQLPNVVRLLADRPFSWEITLDNLTLVPDAAGSRDQWIRFPFGQNPQQTS
jgi:2'-5' RNA ligase